MIKRNSKINVKQFGFGLMLGLLIGIVYNSCMLYYENSLKYEMNPSFEIIENKHTKLSLLDMMGLVKDTNKCNYPKTGPKILCAVFTHKANFETKAKAVDQTWGKRCDKTIYMSGKVNEKEKNSTLNIVYLDVPEVNKLNLTAKTISSILYASEHEEFDWFLKADDDTYVIVENLRYFLSSKCSDDVKNYYGFRYLPKKPERFQFDFNSGGAGYLLSRSSVELFSKKYTTDKTFCRNLSGSEDVDLAQCLAKINITPGETRDKLGRERFHSLDFKNAWELPKNETKWELLNSKFPMKKNEECCSESTISFHYTAGEKALQLDFLLYNIKHKLFELNHNDYFN